VAQTEHEQLMAVDQRFRRWLAEAHRTLETGLHQRATPRDAAPEPCANLTQGLNELERTRAQLHAARQELEARNGQIAQMEADLAELQTSFASRERALEAHAASVETRAQQVRQRKSELRRKATILESQRIEVADESTHREQLREHSTRIEQLEAENERLRTQIEETTMVHIRALQREGASFRRLLGPSLLQRSAPLSPWDGYTPREEQPREPPKVRTPLPPMLDPVEPEDAGLPLVGSEEVTLLAG